MSIPDFQSLMLPTLNALADGSETPLAALRVRVAVSEELTDEDVRKVLPSGQPVFTNYVGWAVKHMKHAGLLELVSRGVYRLTQRGADLLSRNPLRIDMKLLMREYPDYAEWLRGPNTPSSDKGEMENRSDTIVETPEEALDRAARQLSSALEAEVLNRVRSAEPMLLERVVVDLLIAMGYGGGDIERGRVTGRSGDGGIDGTIREDALGLDEVYVQAKRYAEGNDVCASHLHNFASALDVLRRTKGVFVTTAGFTSAAKDFVHKSSKRIVLIDGEELARLMVRHGIGVLTRVRYEIKRIDEDYFDQEAL